MPDNDKPIILTVTVYPIKGSKRPIVVSGAPDGEMPIVHSGAFAEVHQLINRTWAELLKRKPQVPKITAPKPDKASAPQADDATETDTDDGDEAAPEQSPVQPAAPPPAPPPDLPVIEGDQLVASTATDTSTSAAETSAPLLSSLDSEASNG